LSWINYL